MFNVHFADDWIRTSDLWYLKRPLYQLSHNHFPWAKKYVCFVFRFSATKKYTADDPFPVEEDVSSKGFQNTR